MGQAQVQLVIPDDNLANAIITNTYHAYLNLDSKNAVEQFVPQWDFISDNQLAAGLVSSNSSIRYWQGSLKVSFKY